MAQIGNKQNSQLNGDWGKHSSKANGSRKWSKRIGNKRRRAWGRSEIKSQTEQSKSVKRHD